LTLWAFLGLESATVPAGNVRRPEVTIPRATILGTSIAAVIYILVTIAAIGLVPPEVLETSTAPLALAAQSFLGGWGGTLVALGAIVSTFGTLNGFTLLTGQVPYGAARDRVFPALFGRLSGRGTPAIALIASSALASGLIAMNFTKGLVEQFTFIILLATLTTLVPYVFCALSEVVLRLRAGPREGPGAATILLGLLAFVYSAWAIYGAGAEVVYYGFLLLIAGFPVYVWTKGFNSETSGEVLEEL
jgi:amino acid transporter